MHLAHRYIVSDWGPFGRCSVGPRRKFEAGNMEKIDLTNANEKLQQARDATVPEVTALPFELLSRRTKNPPSWSPTLETIAQ